jgi:hypothetical protein
VDAVATANKSLRNLDSQLNLMEKRVTSKTKKSEWFVLGVSPVI